MVIVKEKRKFNYFLLVTLVIVIIFGVCYYLFLKP